jgi:transcriptional regulator with XRE-family HTH domain
MQAGTGKKQGKKDNPRRTGSYETTFKNLPLALRVLREMKGMNQISTAQAAGIGKGQLSAYERGKDIPKLDSLAKVLSALEVDPLALFYLAQTLTRLENGANPLDPLVIGAAFGPAVPKAEGKTFEAILHLISALFAARLSQRIAPFAPAGQERSDSTS